MKIFLALTNIPEEIYLENYPFFFSHDQNWCDEYIQNHRVYFESQEKENKEIFEIIHVFDDEKSLEDFLLHPDYVGKHDRWSGNDSVHYNRHKCRIPLLEHISGFHNNSCNRRILPPQHGNLCNRWFPE